MGQSAPSFYKDILPILRDRCQSCHTTGDIGPMALSTYAEVRPWASAIREAVKLRKMPPWFADPAYGQFANDPRLSPAEVSMIDAWVRGGALEGRKPKDFQSIGNQEPKAFSADLVLAAPSPFP